MHFWIVEVSNFCFQQLKAQQDRADNAILRVENESLKGENFRLQSALRNIACPNCGGPAVLGEISFDEQHLRIENARLKEEVWHFLGNQLNLRYI